MRVPKRSFVDNIVLGFRHQADANLFRSVLEQKKYTIETLDLIGDDNRLFVVKIEKINPTVLFNDILEGFKAIAAQSDVTAEVSRCPYCDCELHEDHKKKYGACFRCLAK